MKKKEFLQDSIGHIDDSIIAEAQGEKKKGKAVLFRYGAVAACLALIIAAIPVSLLIAKRNSFEGDETVASNDIIDENGREIWVDNRQYKEGVDAYREEGAYEWKWEYLDIYEKYIYIDRKISTDTYYTIIHSKIPESSIDAYLGKASAYGYDYANGNERKEIDCEIYSIKGADSSKVIAAKLEGTNEYVSYKYFIREYLPPQTLGKLITENDLVNQIQFNVFTKNQKHEMFTLSDDISKQIWTLLQEQSDATFVEDDPMNDSILNKIDYRNVISFSVSSQELGFQNKSFSIFGTGYIATNIEEYGYYFNIGEETAKQIIKLATENAEPATVENVKKYKWLAGTITEIGDDYFKINDAPMMENEEDGIEFTVNTTDIKILRYFTSGILKVGDTAIVRYNGNIYADEPTVINGAYSIDECQIFGGEAYIPE